MSKKKIVSIVLVGVVILGAIGFIKIRGKSSSKEISVKTSTASKGDVKAFLSTTAVIKSKNSKEYFGAQLKITKVNVKVGDSVKKGDLLVKYDGSDITNSIKQAEIQYNNAVLQKQDLVNQKNEAEKKASDADKQIKDLEKELEVTKDPVRAQQLQTQISQLKTSKGSMPGISGEKIKQAENQVSLAKVGLDSAKQKQNSNKDAIYADFDGVVTQVNVSEGAVGNMAQPAIVLQDISDLKAVVSVGKFDSPKLKVGQDAFISANGEKYNGKISFIDPVAKKSSIPGAAGDTTLNADIDIANKGVNLKVDFDADVEILLGEKNAVLQVPAESIKSDKNGNTSVFVVENGKAKEKKVEIGLQSDLNVEIISGLTEGEKVILNPSASLKNDVSVKEDTGEVSK
ncbi:HlyD family secretion protein [Clostridium amylolyticum]|uniref:HlyD family secretion protein n=1 Tax=Clostridium amylolyticum TaxID=1121298 RepID=A0A1M6MTW3_9CLOT|nr:efflux RND transporter periplasmic adaptor subunit [Clostridium amylolyticum]SHJ86819.1 HlyD family secretion protein [Clostridium amylolyticum]